MLAKYKITPYPAGPQFRSSIFHASYAEDMLSVLLLFQIPAKWFYIC